MGAEGDEGGARVNRKQVSMEISRVSIAKRGGKQASEPEEGVLSGFILRERWRCAVDDARCYVTCRGGRGRGKGAENEFSKKGI